METVLIKKLYRETEKYLDKDITVSGWVRTIRDSKVFGFIELNDGTFFRNIQIVFEEHNIDNFKEITKLPAGSAIMAHGRIVGTPNAKQTFELKATNIQIEGLSEPDYPLQKKRHSFEFLRTIAHLRPRTNAFSAVFRIRSLLLLRYINSFRKEILSMYILLL